VTTAKQVPELVAAHASYLESDLYRRFVGSFFRSMSESINADPKYSGAKMPPITDVYRQGAAWCQQEREHLNISTLFHISDSMSAVAQNAAEQLTGDETWEREALPANNGVLVFEQPLRTTDVWGRTMSFSAATWQWRPDLVPAEGKRQTVIVFSFYTDPRDMSDDYNRAEPGQRDLNLGRWQLAHHVGHVEGGIIGPPSDPESRRIQAEVEEEYRRTASDHTAKLDGGARYDRETGAVVGGDWRPNLLNLGRVMYAIFQLMEQTTIAERSDWEDRRMSRRNSGKNNRTPPRVVVIRLRRESEYGRREEGTGQWLTYRYVRRGHWRNQPYGPQRQQVRRIWINATIVGDPDLPLHQPIRVTTLAK
jgi:hypothetical protein